MRAGFECAWGLWLVLTACAATPESDSADTRCPTRSSAQSVTASLIHAGDSVAYLGLSDAARAAIGLVQDDESRKACSATRITPTWLLTARHCATLLRATFHAQDGSKSAVSEWVSHPELDVALARLSDEPCGSGQTLPIAELVGNPVLSRASLAGLGTTEENQFGTLRFLVEAVVSIDARMVSVAGFGRSGACLGDSGGPLLIRDRWGRSAILGVLSIGAPSCTGEDFYVRVDQLSAWIQEYVELPPASDDCKSIDARGRCFDNQAIWCADGKLSVETCAAESPCGFVARAGGFRCAAAPDCTGDEFGTCESNVVSTCSEAGPFNQDCEALGSSCGYQPRTGVASCL